MPRLLDIRVELLEVTPKIWRRLLIQDDISLIHMGAVLIGAMGWTGSHMFAYEIDGRRYDIKFDDELDIDDSVDMDGVIASDVFKPGVDAAFNYDFGDDWWLSLEVLEHRPVEKGDKPPRCIGGGRAGPPEDSGGPFGFPDMLDAAADPEHPDHLEIKEWLGDHDPERFDVKSTDRNIKKVLKAWSR